MESKMKTSIKEFRGATRWLSNFAEVQVTWNGMTFPTTENAYQASKVMNKDLIVDVPQFNIRGGQTIQKMTYWELCQTCSAKTAKAFSTLDIVKQNLRKDWRDVNLHIMYDLNKQKFLQEPYKTKLIETGDRELQEGNNWGDLFWGVDITSGEGHNHLGRIIMEIRDELNGKQTNYFETL